jgi:hypothetical protein
MPLTDHEKKIILEVLNKWALRVENEMSVSGYAYLNAPPDKPWVDLWNSECWLLLERLKKESKNKNQDERNADAQWLFEQAKKVTRWHPYQRKIFDLAELLADGPLLETIRGYRNPILKKISVETGLDYAFQTFPDPDKATFVFAELANKNDPLGKILHFVLTPPNEQKRKGINPSQLNEMLDHIIQTLMNIKITLPITKTQKRIISILNNLTYPDLQEVITKKIKSQHRADEVLKSDSLLLQWLKTPVTHLGWANGYIYKYHRKATESAPCFKDLQQAAKYEAISRAAPHEAKEIKETKEVKATAILDEKKPKAASEDIAPKLEEEAPKPKEESVLKPEDLAVPPITSPSVAVKEMASEASHIIAPMDPVTITQQQIHANIPQNYTIIPEKKGSEMESETIVQRIGKPDSRFRVDHKMGYFHTDATDRETFQAMIKTFQGAHPKTSPQICAGGDQLETFKNMLAAFQDCYPGQQPQLILRKESDKALWSEALNKTGLKAVFINEINSIAQAPVSEESAPTSRRRP